MIPNIIHEIIHTILLTVSIFTMVYSLLRYKDRSSLALSSFWIWMSILSIAVFINSAVHIASYRGTLSSIEHDVNLGVLTLLSVSLAYYALALNGFQKKVLNFLHRGLKPMNLLTYLDMLTLFKGNVGYAIAYNIGRTYADKLYQASSGDMKILTSLFEDKTGIKKVVLNENSVVFTARKEDATSKAIRALEFFLKGYWRRLLELITKKEVSVDTKTIEKDLAVEILITGLPKHA